MSLNGTWSSPLIIEAAARICDQKTVMVVTLGCTGGHNSTEMYRRVRCAAAKVVVGGEKTLAWEEFGKVMEHTEHVRGSVDFY